MGLSRIKSKFVLMAHKTLLHLMLVSWPTLMTVLCALALLVSAIWFSQWPCFLFFSFLYQLPIHFPFGYIISTHSYKFISGFFSRVLFLVILCVELGAFLCFFIVTHIIIWIKIELIRGLSQYKLHFNYSLSCFSYLLYLLGAPSWGEDKKK